MPITIKAVRPTCTFLLVPGYSIMGYMVHLYESQLDGKKTLLPTLRLLLWSTELEVFTVFS